MPPGNYIGIYCYKFQRWFRWSYSNPEMAKVALQNLTEYWRNNPEKVLHDIEWNFVRYFSDTAISAGMPPLITSGKICRLCKKAIKSGKGGEKWHIVTENGVSHVQHWCCTKPSSYGDKYKKEKKNGSS